MTQIERHLVELVEHDRVLGKGRPVHLLDVQVEIERISAGQVEVDLAPYHLQPAPERVHRIANGLAEHCQGRVVDPLLPELGTDRTPSQIGGLRRSRLLVDVVRDPRDAARCAGDELTRR